MQRSRILCVGMGSRRTGSLLFGPGADARYSGYVCMCVRACVRVCMCVCSRGSVVFVLWIRHVHILLSTTGLNASRWRDAVCHVKPSEGRLNGAHTHTNDLRILLCMTFIVFCNRSDAIVYETLTTPSGNDDVSINVQLCPTRFLRATHRMRAELGSMGAVFLPSVLPFYASTTPTSNHHLRAASKCLPTFSPDKRPGTWIYRMGTLDKL